MIVCRIIDQTTIMVYIQFPADLSEEELMLQARYNKLKGKKKALQEPKVLKQEPERPSQQTPKNAREMAKKLIASGVINARKTLNRPLGSFKRPLGLEKKLSSAKKAVSSYQPFSEVELGGDPPAKKSKVENLYDNFVSATDSEEKTVETEQKSKPPKGNTIFVFGFKITENFLKEHFSVFGNITNITTVTNRKGFITFEEPKSAEEAIIHMDGNRVSSIELQVSMARHQPVFHPINSIASSTAWSSTAARYDRRGFHKDERVLQIYKENIFE